MPTDPHNLPSLRGETASRSKAALHVGAALTAALIPRLWLIAHTTVLGNDGTIFIWMAQNARAGRAVVIEEYPYHPLTAWLIAAVEPLVAGAVGPGPGAWALAGQLTSLLAGMLALLGLYWLGRWTLGHIPAVLGVLLAGWGPEFAHNSVDALSDAPAAMFGVWTLVAVVAAHRNLARPPGRALAWAGAAGALCGLGYLTRPEVLMVAAPAVAVLWIPRRRRPDRPAPPRRRRLAATAALLATLAPLALPYALRIGDVSRKKSLDDLLGLTASGAGLLASVNPGGLNPLVDVYIVIRQWARASHPAVLVLALATLIAWVVAARRPVGPRFDYRPTRAGAAAIWLTVPAWLIMLYLLWTNVGYLSVRHALLPGLLMAPLAGAGAIVGARATLWAAGRLRIRRIPWLSYLGWVAVPLIAMSVTLYRPLHVGKQHNVAFWRWIDQSAEPGATVLASSYRGAYYTDRPVEIVKTGYLANAAMLQRRLDELPHRPEWIMLDSQRLRGRRWDELPPELTELGYRRVRVFASEYPHEHNKLIVYRRTR